MPRECSTHHQATHQSAELRQARNRLDTLFPSHHPSPSVHFGPGPPLLVYFFHLCVPLWTVAAAAAAAAFLVVLIDLICYIYGLFSQCPHATTGEPS